ncbi:MAG: 2-hydroxychromene-2-carboxylate isomerase [Alphaproteobacteria bacterium]|jgi:2-hydroxychromene-2-carboxylate isomerase|nr:2-hydroxychromene-2-carboxylate isomerase [Alphaproteobacteria bacterium]
MTKIVTYYLSPASPYCYLGGQRIAQIAAAADTEVAVKPIDTGRVFAATGGLPLPKRHPARRAYRLVELARWRDQLGLAMHIEPAYFPVDGDLASRVIIAARQADCGPLDLANAVLRAVWEQERDIADAEAVARIIGETGLDAEALIEAAGSDDVSRELEANTDEAIAAGVFGVPWLVYREVPYWGQDRLEFLERALASRVDRA